MNDGYGSNEVLEFGRPLNGAYASAWIDAYGAVPRTATSYDDNPPRASTRTRKNDLDHVFYAGFSRVLSVKVPDVRDFTKPASLVKKKLSDRGCPNYATGDYAYPEDCFVRNSDHQPKNATFELQ